VVAFFLRISLPTHDLSARRIMFGLLATHFEWLLLVFEKNGGSIGLLLV